MKKLIAIGICAIVMSTSYATSPVLPNPKLNAKDVFIPIGVSGSKISVFDLSTMSTKALQKLTGKKMNLLQKVSVKIAQHKLRHSINDDGTFKQRAVEKFFFDCESGFHLGGFALGFFLQIIGVLIAYLIKDDCKPNRVKWAWIGWAITAAIILIGTLAGA